jgi:hypothetical protein
VWSKSMRAEAEYPRFRNSRCSTGGRSAERLSNYFRFGEHVDANLEGSGQPEAASRANWRFSRLTCAR